MSNNNVVEIEIETHSVAVNSTPDPQLFATE